MKTARDVLIKSFVNYKKAKDITKYEALWVYDFWEIRKILKNVRTTLPKKKNPEFWKKGYAEGWNDCLKVVRRVLK